MQLLKKEIDLKPKDRRKNLFKDKKEKLETEHEEREKLFLEKLNENHESSLSRLSDAHQEKIALMERQYLQQKQQVLLSYLYIFVSSVDLVYDVSKLIYLKIVFFICLIFSVFMKYI